MNAPPPFFFFLLLIIYSLRKQTSMAGLQKIQKAVELLSMSQGAPKSMEEATKKRYRFWETQPVPEISKSIKHIITVGTDCSIITKTNL